MVVVTPAPLAWGFFTQKAVFIFINKTSMIYIQRKRGGGSFDAAAFDNSFEVSSRRLTLMIPRSYGEDIAPLTLTLESTAELTSFTCEVTDAKRTPLYYTVAATLERDMPFGEYHYHLDGGGRVLAQGIAIMRREVETPEYEDRIQYAQYGR